MKKLTLILFALLIFLSAACSVFAFDEEETQRMAEEMKEQGLISGVGTNEDGTTNFALHRAMTRQEAVVMLVAILGRVDEVKSGTWESPFTDVDDWAKPFVGYAYQNNYAAGYPGNLFGSHDELKANQYLTFVLKALGYDASTDFDWRSAWLFTDNLGITAGEYTEENNGEFLRGDAIKTAYNALGFLKSKAAAQAEGQIADAVNANSSLPEGMTSALATVSQPVPDGQINGEYQGLKGIVEIAEKYLGVPYKFGGKTPDGFDCSGFVIYVMKEYGLNFSAGCCQDLYTICQPVSAEDLKEGDLLFFSGTYSSGISHVGIYIGDGQMIHASSGYRGCICITEITDSYWIKHFNSYGRMPLN